MSPDDLYSHKPGGSLKLKGASAPKKKKKKSSTTERVREVDSASVAERSASPGGGASGSGSGAKDEAGSGYDVYKTEAQRRFEEVQKKRLLEKAAKAATKTHKDRVAEFNEKLENMSEHYDIPKVGPG